MSCYPRQQANERSQPANPLDVAGLGFPEIRMEVTVILLIDLTKLKMRPTMLPL